jgi:phosphoribosyl-ATP pyrophosphohydrolase
MARHHKAFTLADLSRVIQRRKEEPSTSSYTAMLIEKGPEYVCRKLVEEVLEVALESQKGNRSQMVKELADVFYHALVLGVCHGIDLGDIERSLREEHQKSVRLVGINAERLSAHRAKKWPFSIEEMFRSAGFQLSAGTDVVLLSHNFAKGDACRAQAANLFSPEAKVLKTALQKHGLKVKMGASPERGERYVERRSLEILTPVVFVASHVLLPLCVHLLAAYLKDRIDALRKSRKQLRNDQKVRVVVCTAKGKDKGEWWFVFEGNLQQLQKDLESLGKASEKA